MKFYPLKFEYKKKYEKLIIWAGEMAQWVKALAAKPGDLESPKTSGITIFNSWEAYWVPQREPKTMAINQR